MRSRTSDTLIVLPLLPIFLVGLPPMLLVSFLGFAGLVILGMLLICVGLSGGFDANVLPMHQRAAVHDASSTAAAGNNTSTRRHSASTPTVLI